MDYRQAHAAKVKPILDDTEAILNMTDPAKFIRLTEGLGEFCTQDYRDERGRVPRKISSSQIRSIYDQVQRLPDRYDEEVKRRLQLLRPKLAYARGRHKELEDFQKVFDKLIREVRNKEQLENFKRFFEAVVAYHKAYESSRR